MSPQPPRKPKSGRRQFAPLHGGTGGEWAQVMKDPQVQRALQDPGIRQALYHNLQGTVPGGMSSLLPPEAAATPEAAAPPGPPLRMQEGGLSKEEQIRTLRQLAAKTSDITEKNRLQAQITALEAAQVNEQPMSPVSMGGTTVSGGTMANINKLGQMGPATPGNTAAAMGMGALAGLGTTRQQGLSALVGAGTAGLLNYLIRRYSKKPGDQTGQQSGGGGGGGGAMPHAAGDSTSNTGATEVASAEAWNPNWRTNQPTSSQPAAPAYGPTGGPQSFPGLPNVGALPSTPPGSGPPGGLMMGSANSPSGTVVSTDGGKTWVDKQTNLPYTEGKVINKTPISPGTSSLVNATPATTTTPVDTNTATTATTGAASRDLTTNPLGPAFMADQQKRLNTGLIPRGPAGAFAPGWDEKLGRNTGAGDDSASFMDPYYDTSDDYGLAEGGPVPPKKAVLLRKPPMGLAVPVLHTTIVITPKGKGKAEKGKKAPAKKKQAGGVIKPAKPNLLPPKRGPQNGDHEGRPRPHGRVQVPRGSGAAIKGKRFGGIY